MDLLKDFFVVAVHSNTCRYKRRPHLFNQFKKMVEASGVDMIVVELALGHRPFEVTSAVQANHLRLRSNEEFWHKENLINLGIAHARRLWPKKRRVAWIDADCAPIGRTFQEWMLETWHELQHYEIVQMWEWLQPLDIKLNPIGSPNPSFMANYIKFGNPYPKPIKGYPRQWGSPGLAWAANLSSLDHLADMGIPDGAVLGAGDWYFSHMLISDLPFPDMTKYSRGYLEYWQHRQELCERWIKRDVGFVSGLVTHFYHGKTIDRGYNTRENILIEGQFSPHTDLKRDRQGLWQLETWTPRQMRMRDRIRQYFRFRNEDSVDL